jgi:hypothetical protein
MTRRWRLSCGPGRLVVLSAHRFSTSVPNRAEFRGAQTGLTAEASAASGWWYLSTGFSPPADGKWTSTETFSLVCALNLSKLVILCHISSMDFDFNQSFSWRTIEPSPDFCRYIDAKELELIRRKGAAMTSLVLNWLSMGNGWREHLRSTGLIEGCWRENTLETMVFTCFHHLLSYYIILYCYLYGIFVVGILN